MSSMNYPLALKNLLISAGLLGKGKKILCCKQLYVNKLDTAASDFDNGMQVVKKIPFSSELAVLDIFYVKDKNNFYINDWRLGLTADQVKQINEICKVPIPNEWYDGNVSITEGQVLDLSIPYHCFLYNASFANPLVAKSYDLVDSNTLFWFEDYEEVSVKQDEEVKLYQRSAELVAKASLTEKQQVLRIMFNEHNVLEAGIVTDENSIHYRFSHLISMSNYRKKMVDAFDDKHRVHKNVFYEAKEFNVIIKKENTYYFGKDNKILGTTIKDVCYALEDQELSKLVLDEIKRKKYDVPKISEADINAANNQFELEYDLSWTTYDDLLLQPIEALRAIVVKDGYQYEVGDGIEDIIRKFKEFKKEKELNNDNDDSTDVRSSLAGTTKAKNNKLNANRV